MRTRGTSGQSGRLVYVCVCVCRPCYLLVNGPLTHSLTQLAFDVARYNRLLVPVVVIFIAFVSLSLFCSARSSFSRSQCPLHARHYGCILSFFLSFFLSLTLTVASVHFLINENAFTGFNNNNRTIQLYTRMRCMDWCLCDRHCHR